MKNLIKKILREEFDDFDWIQNYNIIPPSDVSKNPEFLVKLLQTKLKGKKTFNGYDYDVGKEGSSYYIKEIIPNKDDSYFYSVDFEKFNLEYLLSDILRTISDVGFSDAVRNEYKKLFDDLGDVFEK